MKLIESDIPHADDESAGSPPRPPRRRVAVSLLLTLSLLGATVLVIYRVFPRRDNELLTIAISTHAESPVSSYDLSRPTDPEVRAWTIGVLGKRVPWPEMGTAKILGVRAVQIFRRPVAYVRLEIDGHEVSLLALRAQRDALSRKRQKTIGQLWARSWRRGKWTMIAVGDAKGKDVWAPRVDVR